jgi:hypothetical protein
MFETQVDTLTADESLCYAADVQAVSAAADVKLLQVAAHWADLHGVHDQPADTATLPGMEKLVRYGGDGTPEVAEFACAELAAELAMSPYAGQLLIADALDLRHRLPSLWARVRAGDVKPWVGRKTAQATRDLTAATAAVVDTSVAPWADRLTWTRLESLVHATALAADPDYAKAEQDRVTDNLGVWVNPSTDLGTKTAFIRAEATTMTFFDAALDRTADSLGLLGDTASKDTRRARALAILANPHQALDLFADAATATANPDPAPDGLTDDTGLDQADHHGADDPGTHRDIQPAPTRAAHHTCDTCRGRGGRVDSRPPATVYIHLNEDTITRGAHGVARTEGSGPITVDQAKQFLRHCHVTIKPVIDLAGMTPIDGYEATDGLREAVHLITPADTFPYTTNTGRHKDSDHTIPYLHPDNGGPPGQTAIGNLGPLTRLPHRIKTHGRWQVRQPFPGIWIWRSPHGRHLLVDNTGTRRLPKTA